MVGGSGVGCLPDLPAPVRISGVSRDSQVNGGMQSIGQQALPTNTYAPRTPPTRTSTFLAHYALLAQAILAQGSSLGLRKGAVLCYCFVGAMSELTPPARVGKRRTVSPLHEMDGAAEGSPCSTPELQSTDSRVSMEGLANVIRAEIQAGLAPIQTKMNTLQSSVDNRLEQLDKLVCGQGVRIEKLETVLQNILANENTQNKSTNTQLDHMQQQLDQLQSRVDAFNTTSSSPTTPTDISCAMVVGGLQHLATLHAATQWLSDKLSALQGPMHQGTYIKSTTFNGLVFAKFASKLERDTAVALLRSVKFNEGDQTVWATQDLPPNVRARKLFLMGLRWQLGEWGFVKREIHMDEGYSKLMIEDQLILQVSDKADGVLQLAWSNEWANWEEFQQAPELHKLAEKANAILGKHTKGAGKSKSKSRVL